MTTGTATCQSDEFFAEYFDYVEGTEPPLLYHRWCILSGIAALLGRNYGLQFGPSIIYPNMYCMLIGSPGARKDTAIRWMKRLLPGAGYEPFSADRTSKEKFLLDLEGKDNDGPKGKNTGVQEAFLFAEQDSTPREAYICIGEFNDFIGQGNLDFISFLGNMWDYDGTYRNRIKNGVSVNIPFPTINILAGNTSTGFAQAFPPEVTGQGFFSRMILIYGEPSGIRTTIPPTPSPELTEALVSKLQNIKTKAQGQAIISTQAHKLLDAIYQGWTDMDDLRFKTYSTRRFTHLLKLVLIINSTGQSTEILEEQVLYANSILSYTESLMPKALGEFGKSKHSDTAGKIIEVLSSTTRPLKIKELWKMVGNDFDKYGDLAALIGRLAEADKIVVQDGGILLRRGALVNNSQYFDYSLLKEAQEKI